MPETDIGLAPHFNRPELRPAHYPTRCTAYGRIDTAAALLRAISTLSNLSPRPDLAVISGDIADSALLEEYAHAIKLFVGIPGNYDRRALVRETCPDPAYETVAVHSIQCVASTDSIFS